MVNVVRTDKAPLPIGPYSQAIKAGKFLFVSGQAPLDPVSKKVTIGDIEAQTKQVIDNIRAIVVAAGMALDDVVRIGIFLRDMNDFKRMNEVYARYFKDNPPARTTVQAQLPGPEWLIEMDAVACSE
jgi:2-iminobutanoate/2-iminopropanoate deaminase